MIAFYKALIVYALVFLTIEFFMVMKRGPRKSVTKFKGPVGLPPVTSDFTYICENCGMLIETGHGHTREECSDYYAHNMLAPEHLKKRPFYPDYRVTSPTLKGRNDPKIRAPYYYEPGTFQNWMR